MCEARNGATGVLDGGRIAVGLWGRRAAGRLGVVTLLLLGVGGLVNTLALFWALLVRPTPGSPRPHFLGRQALPATPFVRQLTRRSPVYRGHGCLEGHTDVILACCCLAWLMAPEVQQQVRHLRCRPHLLIRNFYSTLSARGAAQAALLQRAPIDRHSLTVSTHSDRTHGGAGGDAAARPAF